MIGWLILILASVIFVAMLFSSLKMLINIFNGSMHWILKIILTIPIVAVDVIVDIFAIPFVINLINSVGGL